MELSTQSDIGGGIAKVVQCPQHCISPCEARGTVGNSPSQQAWNNEAWIF